MDFKVVIKRLASLGCKVSLRGMSPAVRGICLVTNLRVQRTSFEEVCSRYR